MYWFEFVIYFLIPSRSSQCPVRCVCTCICLYMCVCKHTPKTQGSIFKKTGKTKNLFSETRSISSAGRQWTMQYPTSCYHGNHHGDGFCRGPPPIPRTHLPTDHLPVTTTVTALPRLQGPACWHYSRKAKDTPTDPMWPAQQDLIGEIRLRHLAIGCFIKYGS